MDLPVSGLDQHDMPSHRDPTLWEYGANEIAAPFVLRVEAKRNLIHIKISGFWTEGTITDFARDLGAAVASLGCGLDQHIICCDVSDAAIQPRQVMNAFERLIAQGPTQARKMALFSNRVLPRMQSRRIVAMRANIAFFETELAALAWLADGEEA